MRVLMKVQFGLEAGNAAIRDGSLSQKLQMILDEQKPEAAYFTEFDGKRTGILVVELADASQIPALAEPWFLGLDASVEFHPAMTPADLAKAGPAIATAVKKYG